VFPGVHYAGAGGLNAAVPAKKKSPKLQVSCRFEFVYGGVCDSVAVSSI
jgi:hypothetical protein